MAQKQISSALQKSGLSLKDRYEKKQEEELVVASHDHTDGARNPADGPVLYSGSHRAFDHASSRAQAGLCEPAPRILYGGWVSWINQKCAFRTHN